MKITRSIVITLFVLLSTAAHASLISKDFFTPGDGLITYDTSTNLEWLDTYVMAGLSYGQINNKIQTLGAYQGFQFGSYDDVGQLMLDAGLEYYPDEGNNNPGDRFFSFLGPDYPGSETLSMLGQKIQPFPNNPDYFDIRASGFIAGYQGDVGFASLQYVHEGTTIETNGFIVDHDGSFWAGGTHPGAFLKRAAVPEPGSLALLGAGMIGIIITRRRANHGH